MSSKQRGTKRAADSAPSGPNSKSFKAGPKPAFNKGGKDFRNKGKPPAGKFVKPASKPASKPAGKPTKKEDKEEPARRKRPVTQGGGDEAVDEDMSVDGDEDELDGDIEDAPGGGEGAAEEKRGKMSKTERAALHAAQPHRKTLLPSHALLTETLLPLWEQARRVEMPKDERTAAIAELWAAAKDHVLEISRGHKGGRILQTVGVNHTWR